MVGIVCFLSMRYAQFAYKYMNILEEQNVEYELIFWNREGDYKGGKANWISYNEKLNSFQPFYKKIISFLKFTHFMRKQIKEKKYDKLIVLISQTAVPLFDILLKKYKNNYIYDFRDLTFENISLYKKIVDKLVENSYFTAISSEGFKEYLNKSDKFVLSHNSRNLDSFIIEKTNSSKIRIVYWGMVRQVKFNCKLCDLIGNDERFELYYHGGGYHEEIKRYCIDHDYKNVFITGPYELEQIPEFLKHTDLILNLYENDKKQKPAMTVKFYDALKYRIPMIVNDGSYMAKSVLHNNLGITIDITNAESLNYLYKYLTELDYDSFYKSVESVTDEVLKDDRIFEKSLIEFLK